MNKFLVTLTGTALLAVSCETCYQDRFAKDIEGMSLDEVIRTVGMMPTTSYDVANGTLYRWTHDASYTRHHDMSYDEWKDKKGHKQISFTPAYDEYVKRDSSMEIIFRNGKAAVCTFANDGDDCNHFVPHSWIRRYEMEDKAAKQRQTR